MYKIDFYRRNYVNSPFPNEVQRRMATGSAAFATEADAIAKQTLAAAELAKAGLRPPTATFSA